ncbi:MAG: hypothetical protein J5823_04540 [Paludibacteraceae bacterium]|nr:hypothetical protein [Paludibacteraceae bacterium]
MSRHPAVVSIEAIRTHLRANTAHTLTDDMLDLYLRGFKRRMVKQGTYSREAINLALRRGYMTHEMAQLFVDYCLRNA